MLAYISQLGYYCNRGSHRSERSPFNTLPVSSLSLLYPLENWGCIPEHLHKFHQDRTEVQEVSYLEPQQRRFG